MSLVRLGKSRVLADLRHVQESHVKRWVVFLKILNFKRLFLKVKQPRRRGKAIFCQSPTKSTTPPCIYDIVECKCAISLKWLQPCRKFGSSKWVIACGKSDRAYGTACAVWSLCHNTITTLKYVFLSYYLCMWTGLRNTNLRFSLVFILRNPSKKWIMSIAKNKEGTAGVKICEVLEPRQCELHRKLKDSLTCNVGVIRFVFHVLQLLLPIGFTQQNLCYVSKICNETST